MPGLSGLGIGAGRVRPRRPGTDREEDMDASSLTTERDIRSTFKIEDLKGFRAAAGQ